jgi:serine/threonine protein kinase
MEAVQNMLKGTQVGAYRILRKIGEGGMGAVWIAEHAMLGRRAAVKVLHREFSNRPDIVNRFFNEARAATAIPDPGIVQIFDFGNHVDGSAYIVMELLEGETLHERLVRLGRLVPLDALRIMGQLAGSLGAAHACGIVHRDLKPENIFLVRDPEVIGGERAKILDFGIAKLIGDQTVKTQTSAMMGTPTYMSPEQCRGAGYVDQRSDVYALGCVLFALVTGRPPFEAVCVGDIIVMQLTHLAPTPSSRVAGIPPEIDGLVARCLAKNPAERFASAVDLAQAIRAMLGTPAALAMSPASVPTLGSTPPIQTTLSDSIGATSTSDLSATTTRARRWLFGATGIAVAIGGVTSWAVLNENTPEVTATPGSASPSPTSIAQRELERSTAKPVDPKIELCASVKSLFAHFLAWSKDHAGAPCPTLEALQISSNDPWSHPLALTCTDQPKHQMIGVISAGPDGEFGTSDDVSSWQLGCDFTDMMRGEHWGAASKRSTAPSHDTTADKLVDSTKPVDTKTGLKKKTEPAYAGTPQIPVTALHNLNQPIQLDENGLPIKR